MAAALSEDPEEIDLHLADTLAAGAGLCDLDAVRVLVDEGPRRVEELIALGAEFDRDERGNLELAREGGHSVNRIVHAGVATGAEVERALVHAVQRTSSVVFEHAFALDLVLEDGRCAGVVALGPDGPRTIRARNVLLATGGAGQLFEVTTNPREATGDGVAMALRAGVAVADLEFFQFHPTALALPVMPRPLLSEALRGHGALLRDASGERFVDELLPRDVVSRAILAKMVEQGTDHVWLDATGLDHFSDRFPNIAADLARAGLDAGRDLLPVAPAAHHQCGGIVTDLAGASSLPGLWAAGETTCTGVHGANRLASNSLAGGHGVRSPRGGGDRGRRRTGPRPPVPCGPCWASPTGPRGRTRSTSPAGPWRSNPWPERRVAGPVPNGSARTCSTPCPPMPASCARPRAWPRARRWCVPRWPAWTRRPPTWPPRRSGTWPRSRVVLVAAATARTESRGTHARVDHPATDPAQRHRLVVSGVPHSGRD